MKSGNDQATCIFLIHHDDELRKSIHQELVDRGYNCETFEDGQSCLEQLRHFEPAVLIAPLKMPDVSGLHLLQQIKKTAKNTRVIIVTKFGSAKKAVEAMRLGAFSVVEQKRYQQTLWQELELALRMIKQRKESKTDLSSTEEQVLKLLLDGNSNKDIARKMHRSVRTIEDHRGNIMRKMQVNNVVDLVKEAMLRGYSGFPRH